MAEPQAFLPGRSPPPQGALARYLPPIPSGVVETWLEACLPPGEWVLDPFGAAPHLAVEAARAGYRVLVAANNPIARFLLELAANPPRQADLRAALADLAATRKGEERLEPHIRGLYLTACEQCGLEISAEAFLWERESQVPYGRIYHCPSCGEGGEKPASRADKERALSFAAAGLARARALERIAPRQDPLHAHAEEALAAYLPRAVYALFSLINKLDSLPLELHAARRRDLSALLLSALDQANTLWPHPTGRARPRQLNVPRRFRENNVWLALEQAVASLAANGPAVPLTTWPEPAPPQGGVTIFGGRLKELGEALKAAEPNQGRVAAVVAALPRPNQAYWTLSALWAGWLWGRDAIGPFKSVLRRRRYDWAWHHAALQAALNSLAGMLAPGQLFFGLMGEAEPGFLTAALLAAAACGFRLRGLALRAESAQAQITWERAGATALRGASLEPAPLLEAARRHLRQRGEPAPYLSLHAAALSALVEAGALPEALQANPAEAYGQAQAAFEQAFFTTETLARYGGSEKSLEVGQWGLPEPWTAETPLADRVELAAARQLRRRPGALLEEIDAAVCAALPGLLTPSQELVAACLESYGEKESEGGNRWRLRKEDEPAVRREDMMTIRSSLLLLGARLGFSCSPQQPFLWLDPDGHVAYAFFLLPSAAFGELVFSSPYPPSHSIIVLPGARASLVVYKLRRNPRLRQAVEAGWRFLKFRHLRHLAESPTLTRQNLDEQLQLDPLTEALEQMRLL